jgi:hypothetical protein
MNVPLCVLPRYWRPLAFALQTELRNPEAKKNCGCVVKEDEF